MHCKRQSTIRMLGLDTASFSATVEFSTIPANECVRKHRYKLCSLTITNVEILCYKPQQMEYVYRFLPMSYTSLAKTKKFTQWTDDVCSVARDTQTIRNSSIYFCFKYGTNGSDEQFLCNIVSTLTSWWHEIFYNRYFYTTEYRNSGQNVVKFSNRGYASFPIIYENPQISICHEGEMKQVPYWRHKNITPHRTKFDYKGLWQMLIQNINTVLLSIHAVGYILSNIFSWSSLTTRLVR
jgi:hypothetical protein